MDKELYLNLSYSLYTQIPTTIHVHIIYYVINSEDKLNQIFLIAKMPMCQCPIRTFM